MRIIGLFISLSIFSLLVGCKQTALEIRHDSTDNFSNIISQIDKETYNEIDWLTEEPTGGVIVYDGYKFLDIDNDGIDELFVIRKYVNNKERHINDTNKITSIGDYNKFAIRQGFISESYKIVDGKAELLYLDGEPLMTQAFGGGHFGTYYFLLDNGNIAKFYNSYWEENLVIYENMKCKTTISHIGEPGIDEWRWEMDGKKVDKNNVVRYIKNLYLLS